MKKSLLWKLKVLLIVSMFVILFAPGFTAEAAKKDVTINVLGMSCVWLDVLEENQIPIFEEETGIKVNVIRLGLDEIREKLLIDLSSGLGSYDIYFFEQGWTAEFLSSGYLEPLGQYIDKYGTDTSIFFEPALEYWGKWKGDIYAFPWDIDTRFFFYQKDIFEEAGITVSDDPNVYMSPEEFMEILKKVHNLKEGVAGIGYLGGRNLVSEIEWREMYFIFGGGKGKYVLDPETYEPLVNSPEGIAATKFYASWDEYAPQGHTAWAWDENMAAFSQGNVVISFEPSVFAGIFNDPKQSKVAGNLGWFAPPQVDDNPVKAAYGGWGIGISSFSENKEEAYRFLDFAVSKENASERAEYAGVGASQKFVYQDPKIIAKHPYYPFIYERLQQTEGFLPRVTCSSELVDILAVQVSSVVMGKKSAEDAMAEAEKQMTEVLKRTGYIK